MKKLLLLLALFVSFSIVISAQTQSPRATTATPSPTPRPAVRGPRPVNKSELTPKWPAVTEEPIAAEISSTEKTAKGLFEQARTALQQHKPETALPLIVQAEKLVPNRFEVETLLGTTYALLRRWDDAISTFQKAVKLKPESAPMHANLCRALAEAGQRIEAVAECREAVRLDPQATRFRTQLASLYLLDERSQESLELLNAIYDRAQNDLVYLGYLGDSYYLEGDYAAAADIYEKISRNWPAIDMTYLRLSGVYDYLGRYNDSIAAARKYAELEPKSAYAQLNLGRKLSNFGFFDESIGPLEKAAAMDPKSGEAFLTLSDVYDTLGDFDNLVRCLKKAYEIGPQTAQLSYRVGIALADHGYRKESVEPLERANKAMPDNPDILLALGFQYLDIQKYDEGIEMVERSQKIRPLPSNMTINLSGVKKRNELLSRFDQIVAYLKANPGSIPAHHDLADAYLYKGLVNEAEHEYLEMVRLAPTYQNYNLLSVFYTDHDQYEKAVDAIRKAIALYQHHILYHTLSYLQQRLGHLDEAINAARKSVEIKPDSLDMHLWLGELLLKKGTRDEALREYQTAFDLASGDPRPNFSLAWLYIRLGNKQGAMRHYEILKGITPPDQLKNLELCIRAHFGPVT